MIPGVVFDVGECLVDESREYGTWADWLGIPRHTFSSVFGATIARGLDYRETFQCSGPDSTWLRNAVGVLMRACLSGSVKPTCTQTCALH